MKRETQGQLDLFAPSPPPPIRDEGPLRALAARLPRHVRFGTSSWTFAGWTGLVYTEHHSSQEQFVKRSLAEYARHPLFRTVGIDRSFYAPIPVEDLRDYAAQLPDDFRAVSKVWSELTTQVFPDHPRLGDRAGRPNPYFLDPGLFAEQLAAPYAEAFAAHAGPFVLEIPPQPGRPDAVAFEHALSRFLRSAPSQFQYAVELRDPRLVTQRHLELLRDHGATHVFNFWSRMPPLREQLALPLAMVPGTQVVARLMLPPGETYERLKEAWAPFDRIQAPQPELREDVVSLVVRAAELGCELFVIVNNKAEGSSPLTIRAICELLVGAR